MLSIAQASFASMGWFTPKRAVQLVVADAVFSDDRSVERQVMTVTVAVALTVTGKVAVVGVLTDDRSVEELGMPDCLM
jgi:hypothetical protein